MPPFVAVTEEMEIVFTGEISGGGGKGGGPKRGFKEAKSVTRPVPDVS